MSHCGIDSCSKLWGVQASVAVACGHSSFGSQALEQGLNSCLTRA